ncbi:condensation domain-containing protein [Serratia quinivorans]|uniref:condensation domain-containing protein n=1 Tax=Serratia quinivorans TaxID=137545 RepID=UPI0021783955|nr:condensation domain-containing protein [Serratia quinivorans]CAI1013459.1 Dimodular nonribosomal peptide synthase [Serratia quinivorans]
MSGYFDNILSDDEAQRLDLAFETLGARAQDASQPLSEAEELAWFMHQQRGDGSCQQAMAWRLGGEPDIGRLVSALEALTRLMPELDVRYDFDDEQGLRKLRGSATLNPVSIQAVIGQQQAVSRLLQAQAAPFELAREAPIRFLLFTGSGAILGVVAHDILAPTLSCRQLLTTLSALYNGIEPTPGFAIISPVATLPEATELVLPWPRQATALRDYQTSVPQDELLAQAGVRIATRVARKILPAADNPATLLAAIAVRFARFISAQAGGQPVQLSVPQGDAQQASGLDAWMSPAQLKRLTLGPVDPEEESRLLAQQTAELANPQLAQLLVTWLADSSVALQLDGVSAERLLLPPLHTPFEMVLALSLPEPDSVVLELVTDPRLTPHAAPFLLEQFVAFLAGRLITAALLPAAERPSTLPESVLATQDAPAENAEIAQLILAEFRDALVAPEMTADEDFFDRGGHSLVATRVIGRLLSLHRIELNINDLFSHATARGLSAYAKSQAVAEPNAQQLAAQPQGEAVQAPLSLAQHSLWKVYEAFGHDEIFNLPFAICFLDPVDETALRQAFIDVMTRHSVLRSLFIDRDGEVYQQVVPAADLLDYGWFHFSDQTPAGNASELLARAGDHRFDLTAELPLRVTFLRDAATGQQLLSLLFHHVVLDEWSLNLMMDELGVAYSQRVAGQVPQWKSAVPQFHAFARQQQAGGVVQQHLDYWLDNLRDAPVGQPLFQQQPSHHPAVPAEADVDGGWLEFDVDPAVADGLYAQARKNNASLFNVVYAGITMALRLLGGPADLLVGTSTSGRNDAEFFDTIGYFTTVVVHRVRFAEQLTVAGLIDQVKNTINGSMPYTDIPIDLVEEGLFGVDADRKNHMFEVFIQIHSRIKLNGAFILQDGSRVAYRQVEPEKTASLLGLQFEVMEENLDGVKSLRVMMTYRTDHYTAQQAELIAGSIQHVFSHFAQLADGDMPLAALPPVPRQ